MDDQPLNDEQVRASVSRQRKRTVVTLLVSLFIFTFVPVVRGKGHSPLFTAIVFGITVLILFVTLTLSYRSAKRSGAYALMAQRAQRPGESYWRYYQRYLSSEPSHHPAYRRLILIGAIELALSIPLVILTLALGNHQLGMELVIIPLGLAFLALGGAESLPKGRRKPAMALRVFATALLLVTLIAIYSSLLF